MMNDIYNPFDITLNKTNALLNHVQRIILVVGKNVEFDRVDITFLGNEDIFDSYGDGIDNFKKEHPNVSFDDAFVSVQVPGMLLHPNDIRYYVVESDAFIDHYHYVKTSDRADAKIYTLDSAIRDVEQQYKQSNALYDVGPMKQISNIFDLSLYEIPVREEKRMDFEKRMRLLYESIVDKIKHEE